LKPITFGELVAHYLERNCLKTEHGQGSQGSLDDSYLSQITWKVDLAACNRTSSDQIPFGASEDWLHGLSHMKNGTKAKCGNIMKARSFAMRSATDFYPARTIPIPFSTCGQSAESDVIHTILHERTDLGHSQSPGGACCVRWLPDAFTGLRVSVAVGIEVERYRFRRDAGGARQRAMFTAWLAVQVQSSKKPVPLDPVLAEALQRWRITSPYNQPEDWVFASPKLQAENRSRGNADQVSSSAAAKKAGISGKDRLAHLPPNIAFHCS